MRSLLVALVVVLPVLASGCVPRKKPAADNPTADNPAVEAKTHGKFGRIDNTDDEPVKAFVIVNAVRDESSSGASSGRWRRGA